jgi:hypothetical protein
MSKAIHGETVEVCLVVRKGGGYAMAVDKNSSLAPLLVARDRWEESRPPIQRLYASDAGAPSMVCRLTLSHDVMVPTRNSSITHRCWSR